MAETSVEYSNTEISRAIDDYVHSARDRDIVRARLIDGLTYSELSGKFNLSERQLKNIVYKAQNRIFDRRR